MVKKIIVVYCCLFLVKVVQSIEDVILKKIFNHNYIDFKITKRNESMNTNIDTNINERMNDGIKNENATITTELGKRQYEVLKHLKEFLEQRQRESNYKKLDNIILKDGFYEEINLEKFEFNIILKELHDNGYIYDVAIVEPKFTDVHTCKITDKGLDALKKYENVEKECKKIEEELILRKELEKKIRLEIEDEEKKKRKRKDDDWHTKMKKLIPNFIDTIIKVITKIIGVYVIILIIEN